MLSLRENFFFKIVIIGMDNLTQKTDFSPLIIISPLIPLIFQKSKEKFVFLQIFQISPNEIVLEKLSMGVVVI